jgi:hypothetical protein
VGRLESPSQTYVPLRFALLRAGNDPGFLILQSFQIAVPCGGAEARPLAKTPLQTYAPARGDSY